MKLFSIQLFILASSLSAFAASVRSGPIPQSLANACPSAEVLISSRINVNGEEILRQVFSCPDGNLTVPAIPNAQRVSSSAISGRSSIEARVASECTTPAAECQCGQPVICGCDSASTGQTASDCTALIASLPVIASITEPTFLVQPGTVHTTTLRTCSVSLTNLGSTPEEFCWDDLASQATSEISCINSRADAICVAENQRFLVHLGVTV